MTKKEKEVCVQIDEFAPKPIAIPEAIDMEPISKRPTGRS